MTVKSNIKKYGIAAALVGAGFVGAQILDKDDAPAPPAPRDIPAAYDKKVEKTEPPTPALEAGYYRPSGDLASLWVGASGGLHIARGFDRGTCIEVTDGPEGYQYATVKIVGAPTTAISGFMKKEELRKAAECAAIAQRFAVEAQAEQNLPAQQPWNPPAPQGPATGIRLRSVAFLYAEPVNGGQPIAQLLPDDCVKVEEVRQSQGWTKVTAGVQGRSVTGWGVNLNVDPGRTCTPG